MIQALVYGNGGLVGWHKETCLNMKTHENAEETGGEEAGGDDCCWG